MKKKLKVLENRGYGIYRTDAGSYLVDYALNGVDMVLQNSDTGAVEYLILEMERNDENRLTAFQVEEFLQETPEAPGYEKH